MESFGHPRRFARIARRIGRTKPIVAVKSGRTLGGARAASSHTGALASVEGAVSALFRQSGVIRTDTLEELFEVTSLLANQPLPKGRRVGVLTNAGGPAILAIDALESEGLQVPVFSDALQERLKVGLAREAAVRNPVDMIASAGPDQYRSCLRALLDSDEVDSVIVVFIPTTPGGLDAVQLAVAELVNGGGHDKTVLAVYMEADIDTMPHHAEGTKRIPIYPFPEPAARALARASRYAEWRASPLGEVVHFDDVDRDAARAAIDAALARLGGEGGWLEPSEAEAVLDAYRIRRAASRFVTSAEEAVAAAEEIGGAVALKVVAPSVLHKTEVGGLALDVRGAGPIAAAYQRVTGVAKDARGALIQEFVGGGHEVIIGMTEDPSFGPLLAFGLGGVYVELIGDVAFRIHPLTDVDAQQMIGEVKAARLLDGYRGGDPGDIPALKEALPPGQGLRVVDLRMRVRPVPQRWLPSRKDIPAARKA
jgi:acyl-CoA synthetase (NDP forming)